MKDNISKHITYKEATHSNTATRKGITNSPSDEQLENMKTLAENVLEPAREHYGKPIYYNSFFRAMALNSAIGGSHTSQHCSGEAADIDTKGREGFSNANLFNWIKDNCDFDQLLWEFGTDVEPDWVHVSYREGNNRKQILIVKRIQGKTTYTNY